MPITVPLRVPIAPPIILPGSVRVRLAPSPTGALHIGTARTALFNLLFARKYRGVFVLRIEDTDLERSDALFEKDIVENLKWLGISWDEGIEVGGDFSPYLQSERVYLYAKYLERLLEEKKAYHCFCTEEQLAKDRQEALAKKSAPRYSGRCANLSDSAVRERLGKGEHSILRIRVPSHNVSFVDLIRGEITFDSGLWGDIAIAKTISAPLYNFAVVVDDFEMKITHVIRGEDHITNTPKQMLIAQALGMGSPLYAHLPLVLGQDHSKLSKRHGATTIQELREAGYLPEALDNFLALLGWNPGNDQELFSFEELVAQFSIDRVQKGGAVWNQKKLEWFNRAFAKNAGLRWLTKNPISKKFIRRMERIFTHTHTVQEFGDKERKKLTAIAQLVLERMNLLELDTYLLEDFGFFFALPVYDPKLLVWKHMSFQEIMAQLSETKTTIEQVPEHSFGKEIGERLLQKAERQEDRGVLLWPLRVALSGKKQSPGPHEIATILGKEETLARITHAINIVRPLTKANPVR